MKTELIMDVSFPCGVKCIECERTAKVGDFVSFSRKRLNDKPFVLLFHSECLKKMVKELPPETSPRISELTVQVADALASMKGN